MQGCTCLALLAGEWAVGLIALLLATSLAIQDRISSSNCTAQVKLSWSGLQERLRNSHSCMLKLSWGSRSWA